MSTFINSPHATLKRADQFIGADPAVTDAVDALQWPTRRSHAIPAHEHSTYRQAKIAAIKAQIADGTYETAERLRVTIDRLLQSLAS